ncbi:MAG TPA: DUF2863 family protein [Pusillimonas sp.]|uniref:DUF2863 family protein n=1 Tax=Pusillimonas sp. TaxID=3040095 RepID=UPI002C510703|nr:DUF2863 family protein [Pusillimonas sp.]HUH88149.1 DUF2863 family protein [Pusillimonas sp.]
MSTHTRSTPSTRLPRDAQRLVVLAESLARSGSRLEDAYWEGLFQAQLVKLLTQKKSDAIDTALDHLLAANSEAYEILIEQVETHSESSTLTHEGQDYDVLLFCAPIVAWTRYQLPSSYDLRPVLDTLAEHLHTHIVARDAQVSLLSEMLNFDQMPRSFHETLEWTQRLGRAALKQKNENSPLKQAPFSDGMLADARFVIGAIVVPKGGPLFRWQEGAPEATISREQCFQGWQDACSQALQAMFTGCTIEYLQPDAYYISSREADRRIRPLALKAAATWLQTAAGLPGNQLRATTVACGETSVEEYRIGFSTSQSADVIYGCIWPVLSKEEAVADLLDTNGTSIPEEIAALLKEQGITDVRQLPGLFRPEFCDDCGAPYFPDPLGEMQHPELPDEIDVNPLSFH